jgi:hypothetical protein
MYPCARIQKKERRMEWKLALSDTGADQQMTEIATSTNDANAQAYSVRTETPCGRPVAADEPNPDLDPVPAHYGAA